MSGNLIIKKCFRTSEEFSQALNTGRQLAVSQLSLNSFKGDVLLIESDQIQFLFTELSCPIRVVGAKGNKLLEFSFVLQPGKQELFSHNVAVSQNTMFGFDPTREVNLVVPANCIMCVAQIKQEAFDLWAQAMERSDLNSRFLKTNYLVAPEILLGVQTYLKELYHLALHRPEFLSYSQSHHILFEDFLPLLVDSIPPSSGKANQSLRSPRRLELVKQSDAYLQSQLTEPITLMDLCKAMHSSERSLIYGFREVFGVSPMAYLKALRLQAVRKQLQLADPKTAVIAEIASQFGFWSLGHFSRDYKTMFGELPSETLKLPSHNGQSIREPGSYLNP